MRSLPRSLAVSALAYGTALTLAAWLFDGFRVEPLWLLAAVAIFMVLTIALRRVLLSTVNRFVRGYTMIGGLLLTFVALWMTDVLVPPVGFDIDGTWAWVGVTGLVWAAGVAYGEADTKAPAGTPGVSP
jgi:low temperature requirement protein LtrA